MSRLFDGVDDVITIAQNQILGNAALVLSFKLDSLPAAGSTMVLYDHRGTNGRGNAVFVNSSLTVRFGYSSATQRNEDFVYNAVSAGIWYTVAATFSPVDADGIGSLYVNGKLADNTTSRNIPGGTNGQGTIRIGTDISGASAMSGQIAHIIWYKRFLGVGELIQSTYYPGSIGNDFSMVMNFPLRGTASPEPGYSKSSLLGTVSGPLNGTTEPPINGMFTIPRPELMRSF